MESGAPCEAGGGGGESREAEADPAARDFDVGQLLGDLTLKWAGGPHSRCADSGQFSLLYRV